MRSKLLYIGLFVAIMAIQLLVPSTIIWSHENTLATGKIYRFETEPIDPSDPFRGKYVTLRYKHDRVTIENGESTDFNTDVYVTLAKNEDGFAIPKLVSNTEPTTGDFIKVKKGYYSSNSLSIDYPFNRFYMNEYKAKEAVLAYFDGTRDTTKKTYAQVRIKNGHSVLENVFIDGIELKKIAEMRLNDL